LPSSDKLKPLIPTELDSLGITWTRADLYRTVMSDLSDLEDVFYDVLVFFSPSGIDSLYKNFPDYQQKETRIAAFGSTTVKAVEDAGLTCNIIAPTPETPSMTMALDKYLKEANKK
jgi:uroporphyrinogen-III synthase